MKDNTEEKEIKCTLKSSCLVINGLLLFSRLFIYIFLFPLLFSFSYHWVPTEYGEYQLIH